MLVVFIPFLVVSGMTIVVSFSLVVVAYILFGGILIIIGWSFWILTGIAIITTIVTILFITLPLLISYFLWSWTIEYMDLWGWDEILFYVTTYIEMKTLTTIAYPIVWIVYLYYALFYP